MYGVSSCLLLALLQLQSFLPWQLPGFLPTPFERLEFVQSVVAQRTAPHLSWQLWRSCRSSAHKPSAPASCSPCTRCVLSVDHDELRISYYCICIFIYSLLSLLLVVQHSCFCWQAPTLVKHRTHTHRKSTWHREFRIKWSCKSIPQKTPSQRKWARPAAHWAQNLLWALCFCSFQQPFQMLDEPGIFPAMRFQIHEKRASNELMVMMAISCHFSAPDLADLADLECIGILNHSRRRNEHQTGLC